MNPPPSHGVRVFVRNAWVLLTFQLLAAAVALGVTGWAALQVRPLLEQRTRLEKQIGEAQARVAQLAEAEKHAREEIAALEQRAAKLRDELKGARESTPILSDAINAYHKGNYDEAVTKYDQALKLNPGDPYIRNLKSYSQYKTGDYKGAERTLSTALELNPTYDWGYFDLARYQCASGAPQEALKTINAAVAKRGDKIRSDLRFFLSKDAEFTNACRQIRSDLQRIAAPNR
jgi:tetratricopeptide (TPR) repeat protein